jgi:(p)ppGpp synthase/HD superfamily hydrolase
LEEKEEKTQLELARELAQRWMPGNRQSKPGIPTREAWRHPEDIVKMIDWWAPESSTPFVNHMKCVAWLHDIIEDGRREDGSIISSTDLLVTGVHIDIISDVLHLTQGVDEDKALALERVSKAPLSARIVKCFDRICNLKEGSKTFKTGRWNRYIVQTREYIIPLAESVDQELECEWFVPEMEAAILLRPTTE